MQIRRLRVPGHTDRSDPPLAAQAKTQNHDQWQREAVLAQLHRLPTISLIPQLPAIDVPAQSAKSPTVIQQNLPRQHPDAMKQAGESPEQTGPEWNRKQKQRTQCERLGQQIRRQQLP
ncbi:hypothetical protein PMI23_00638 [Pseudomonas sp. GM24]|nr:hypothetical protein PMI19_01664 [Pseudomonas sp. GM16]EJM45056.1 hypothetical protein PMI23_00638 [Pseudomonas sp. GM24]